LEGFDTGFGAELALIGLGEIKDGFDSRIGMELGETGRDRASCYYVLCSWEMTDDTVELRQERQAALLHDGPGRRSPEQGMS